MKASYSTLAGEVTTPVKNNKRKRESTSPDRETPPKRKNKVGRQVVKLEHNITPEEDQAFTAVVDRLCGNVINPPPHIKSKITACILSARYTKSDSVCVFVLNAILKKKGMVTFA